MTAPTLLVKTPPEQVSHETILQWARDSGCKVADLLAMHPNADPFYAGQRRKRVQAEWFTRLWEANSGTSLRRLHYRLVSLPQPPRIPPSERKSAVAGRPYENTEACWAYLQEASTFARHLGLVPADAFIDRRNPPPHEFVTYDGETPFPEWSVDEFLPWNLPAVPAALAFDDAIELPGVVVSGYDYRQADQPYHLELWIEKSTMADVLEPVCEDLGITYVPGIGFQSITSTIQLLKRLEILPGGKPARIFYVSDFDPAGKHMPVAVARQLEFYRAQYAPRAEVLLTPLALTVDQVAHYGLPRIPIKDSDRRKGRFEALHGTGATELDALEAIHPGELAKLVREAAAPYRDPTLAARLEEARDEAQEEAERLWGEATAPLRQELAQIQEEAGRLVTAYRQEMRRLRAELEEELAPLQERVGRVRHTALGLAGQPDGESPELERVRHTALGDGECLPERPEPEVDVPDEGGWLFDSNRTYLEQLDAYRQRRGDRQCAEDADDE